MTGFYRDGYCRSGPEDGGNHAVAGLLTKEFLDFSAARGPVGTPAVHLVFFDRHGWYCEHGRSCHAVDDVRKLAGSLVARTYSVG